MAKKEAKAPSSAKINKVNRNLSGAIGELGANLHNMVYGSKNLKDAEEITHSFNDILKGNRAFLANSVYHTEYGIEMKRLHFDGMIEEMIILESIIL